MAFIQKDEKGNIVAIFAIKQAALNGLIEVADDDPAIVTGVAKTDFTREAIDRLTATDVVVVRYLEAGNPVPAEWIKYRQTLRDIAHGITPGPLPQEPATGF